MMYAYWCETKDGQTLNFVDEQFYEPSTTITRDGIEYAVMDIAEEYPISVSEILEVLEEERGGWK